VIQAAALLLVALFAGRQDPPAPPSPTPQQPAAEGDQRSAEGEPPPPEVRRASPEGEWHDLDQVVQIVNDRMLTGRELLRELSRINRKRPFANEGEAREAQKQIRSERVKDALRTQAGQDLGLDPTQVKRRIKDLMRRQQEELKGSVGMAAYLENRDRTLFEEEELLRDALNATLWDNYITGEGSVGESARQTRDVYVRPGYLSYLYRQCLERPELLPVIGGVDRSVVLQQLFVDLESAGGEEAGEALAQDLRRRIVDGEDMGELVERYDAANTNKQKRGMTEPLSESRLKEGDPSVAAFVAGAKPGDVSELLPYNVKEHQYARIVRLVERKPAVTPDLRSADVQKKLTERIQEDLSQWRRMEGFRQLAKASYIWPPELIPR
jgi:hypothetical protein